MNLLGRRFLLPDCMSVSCGCCDCGVLSCEEQSVARKIL